MKLLLNCLLLATATAVYAQPKEAFPLWAKDTPGALGTDPVKDIPTLTPFFAPADKATGAAIVICPGGGYSYVVIDKEGTEIAAWLNTNGISALVLKYRTPNNRAGALQDLQGALSLTRSRAAEWNVAFTGFAPGFAYLVSEDWPWDVPRLSRPRTRVPAGAISTALIPLWATAILVISGAIGLYIWVRNPTTSATK